MTNLSSHSGVTKDSSFLRHNAVSMSGVHSLQGLQCHNLKDHAVDQLILKMKALWSFSTSENTHLMQHHIQEDLNPQITRYQTYHQHVVTLTVHKQSLSFIC